ncbi:MAG: hypothetical protein GX876_05310 [Bacteroidales bacterium]|nr:hypothetical protein [Bacteroidales bacterium]
MVKFTPYEHNPVFTGTKEDTRDRFIRERGFILLENGLYKMWSRDMTAGNPIVEGDHYSQ